ncbi:glucose-6-phosphate isomerase [Candidatus Omnitrophus magneticus]|uniref:Glucose-6-phosphate isomerase n=1 Tax=Candidatus Omnitrophus magneticus TaxID=1609969 RepID=A0A0F0CRC4_9BACT|nr:glucose-6-phosphate isomerase [Candidatus Omnitrophus magneticus]
MKFNLRYDTKYLDGFVSPKEMDSIWPEIQKSQGYLTARNGQGKEFLGWLDLPKNIDVNMVRDIEETAQKLRVNADVIVVIGIGGSYLGAKAVVEMLQPEFGEKKIIFAGHNLSAQYIAELLEFLKTKEVAINVISKSGETTEPAVIFRVLENFMRGKYGNDEIKDRIVCTTDAKKGLLKKIAEANGYKTFVIPDDIGGRFSVLTPVGLLPIAAAGINIWNFIAGARTAREALESGTLDTNISYKYAAVRNILYRKGKCIEVLSNFDYRLHYAAEWWKQLFGESEGKENKGIFPASCDFTTDLHSMGQLLQDGERNIFETFLIVEKELNDIEIPFAPKDLDKLNYLTGKEISFVNEQAYKGTSEAHFEGGVPNSAIILPNKTDFSIGELFYFFEKVVAISAYTLGVNPFNQPGVEAYKKKMFMLLGKNL